MCLHSYSNFTIAFPNMVSEAISIHIIAPLDCASLWYASVITCRALVVGQLRVKSMHLAAKQMKNLNTFHGYHLKNMITHSRTWKVWWRWSSMLMITLFRHKWMSKRNSLPLKLFKVQISITYGMATQMPHFQQPCYVHGRTSLKKLPPALLWPTYCM